MNKTFVIIGGDAAGMSAASKAKREAPDIDVVVFEKGDWISYGACGLPYYVKGDIESLEELISVTPEEAIHERDIDLRLHHEVTAIDRDAQTITARTDDGKKTIEQPYDDLLIATGARATLPSIEGTDLGGVFTLHSLADGQLLREALSGNGPKRRGGSQRHETLTETSVLRYLNSETPDTVGIIGGGVLGIEMAEAFEANGLDVHLFHRGDQVLKPFGEAVAREVEDHLREHDVTVHLETEIDRVIGDAGRVTALDAGETTIPVDLVLFGTGVKPNVDLATTAEIERGTTGAIAIDEYGRTNDDHVFAAGDCAEVTHVVTGEQVYIPLALTANRQGRAIGQTVTGTPTPVGAVAGTTAVKVFDLEVARTGVVAYEDAAEGAGFDPVSRTITAPSRSGYYPGGSPITVELVGDRTTGRVLGASMVGREGVAKRIDTIVTALFAEMTAPDVEQLDLAYTPPISPVWDPVLIAARVLQKELDGQPSDYGE